MPTLNWRTRTAAVRRGHSNEFRLEFDGLKLLDKHHMFNLLCLLPMNKKIKIPTRTELVIEQITEFIFSGQWPAGEILPPEQKLCAKANLETFWPKAYKERPGKSARAQRNLPSIPRVWKSPCTILGPRGWSA